MNNFYAQVTTNGAVERVNIQLPTILNNTSIPAGATDLEQFGLYPIQGSEPIYDNTTQRLIGPQYVFDGDTVQRVYVVEAIPSADLQSDIWARIKQIRDINTQQGGYKAQGKWFHSDTFSRSQQIGLVIMGSSIPAGLQWKTMDGSFVEMTPTLAQAVFQAAALQDNLLFSYAEQLNQQVKLSTNPTSIDIEQGWPETYKEV